MTATTTFASPDAATSAGFWNRIAENYAASPVANPDAFERKIAITKARMTPQDTVLDIGCGTGSLALRLAETGADLHGLDVSSEMVRIANGKAQAQGIRNVAFHCGPFDDSFDVFADGSLDGVCAYSILHLIPNRRPALDRIFTLLKPGGFFVSSTVCLRESWIPFGPAIAAMRLFGKAPKFVATITKQTLADELREAGFVDIEMPDVGAEKICGFIVATRPAN